MRQFLKNSFTVSALMLGLSAGAMAADTTAVRPATPATPASPAITQPHATTATPHRGATVQRPAVSNTHAAQPATPANPGGVTAPRAGVTQPGTAATSATRPAAPQASVPAVTTPATPRVN